MARPVTKHVLVADSALDRYWQKLTGRFPNVKFTGCRSAASLADALSAHEYCAVYSCVSSEFPRHEHSCIQEIAPRWLHVGGSGFDHFSRLDLNQTLLTNGRGVLAPFLADTVIGAIIALNHGFLQFLEDQKSGQYIPRVHPALGGQQLLIIGPGAIGQALAAKARALGIICSAVSRTAKQLLGFEQVYTFGQLDVALAAADIVSLHVPLKYNTANLFGQKQFNLMKPSALFVNCSRGGVVNQTALTHALQNQAIRGAYLDVFETEPLPANDPLRFLPNTLLTPHCSDQAAGWQSCHADFFMKNLEKWLDGLPLENQILPVTN